MSDISFGPAHIRAIAPYQGGKPISEVAREYQLNESEIIKLASNENPLGVPKSAKEAMMRAVTELSRYPDANGFELKEALSKKYQVPTEWITLGNGSNDILELISHAIVEKGQSIIYSQYSFLVYALTTQAIGANAIIVPAKNYGHDLDRMANAITENTRLIFIANPNNPTGTFLSAHSVEAFLKKIPQHIVVVLDEAYNEFLPHKDQYESSAWVHTYPNLLIVRTFSKAYGLAGLRIGFGLAQTAITDLLNRIRQPFNVNSLAQAAAIAALNDIKFLQQSATLNQEGYQQLTKAFEQMGLPYIPSYGNFIMIKVGNDNGAGARINLELLKRGIIVRPIANYGLPQWLRVSIGLPNENAAFISALNTILQTIEPINKIEIC
jgi:histidinol-phosphate aminotransferase